MTKHNPTTNKEINKKTIKIRNVLLLLILPLVIALALSPVEAKVFTIQNESVNMFVVNGTTGNILLNPNAGFGNVGIGTTSPLSTLHLKGVSGVSSPNITLGNNPPSWSVIYHDTEVDDSLHIYNMRANDAANLYLGTRGTDRITILGNGNVGIGTTAPGATLAVTGNATISRNLTFSGGSGIKLSQSQHEYIRGDTADSGLSYWSNRAGARIYINTNNAAESADTTFAVFSGAEPTGGTQRFTIQSGGNVGIGTASPNATLHVRHVGTGLPATSGTAQSAGHIMRFDDNSNGILDIGGNTGPFWLQATDKTDLGAGYSLLLNPNGGNVGIGTTNPIELLHVGDNLDLTGSGGVNRRIVVATKGGGTGSSGITLGLYSDKYNATIKNEDVTANGLGLHFQNVDAGNPVTRMFIDRVAGKVGIGTTAPAAKLEVVGNVSINGSLSLLGENSSLYQPVYGTDDDLVLYLPFNAPNGTTQYDRSPYGNDGVLQGGIVCNATLGKYGAGCNINNNTFDRINVSSAFGLGNSSTLETWVNLDSTSKSGSFIKVGATLDGYVIGVGSSTFDNDGNDFIMLYENVRWIDTNTLIGTGWHHVAMVIDSAGVPEGFLDGSSIGKFAGADANAPTANTLIGGYIGNSGENRHGNYSLDEVRIYKRALAPEEIRTHYLRGKGFGASGAITADTFRVVNTSGNVKFQISPNGNVGIGTTSPGQKLTIDSGSVNISNRDKAFLYLNPSAVTGGEHANITYPSAVGGEADLARIGMEFKSDSSTDFHVSLRDDSTSVITTPFFIDGSSGNVGIGTTTPASTLTVVGNGSVSGAFSKGSGTFLIDHPLDPLNKKLQHSFAESPEMLNIYKGHNSTKQGKAAIKMPYWFNALNGDDIGNYEVIVSAYDKCGQLWADKNGLTKNYFEVYSDNDCEFAWVVYAVRHDAFALSHPVAVESEKSENEKGKCIHKEACHKFP